MEEGRTIAFLNRNKLDATKYNRCIDTASNGLIYGYTYYLDFTAHLWGALVLNDYEAVMPLPYRKKFGIYYVYQPFLTAQLGVFGKEVTQAVVQEFLRAVPAYFKFWEFSLNYANLYPIPDFHLFQRINYVLDLSPGYDYLYRNYRENAQRNIKKSLQYGCMLQTGIDVRDVIQIATQNNLFSSLEDIDRLKFLFDTLSQKDLLKSYGIYSKKEKLIASAIFIFSHNRAYYILVGNHPDGRTLGASHALIDAFIQDYAGQNLLLDFEGSDLRNLAFFYSSFGAIQQNYAAVRENRLPWYLRWMKR